ncbi:MAG: fibrillarin-like rRNA/tRNA 2'-O-methyltransferase [Nitrososphaerota archaeon]|nr:fibrillarin-like rRNA/tRNA 2'-O-methyltransferase [Candidatus Calditenuaceae archaeon]MDW8073163.1 fibrillarin-like rRNA/tRNA 2'-O-methyltransferase [Nitrososphaerota archaeon]
MSVEEHYVFKGVYHLRTEGQRILLTENLDRGFSVYGERLFTIGGLEYREWVPFRSKLAAAILCGLKGWNLGRGRTVLYLGAASGTTLSHVSDIIGREGFAYAIEFAPRVMSQLIERVARRRRNVVAVFADARMPERYAGIVDIVDLIYCDIAQPEQSRILVENAEHFLKRGGEVMIAIKSRSIDSVEEPEKIYRREIKTMEDWGFKVLETTNLAPYEEDHVLVRARYE